MRASRRKVQGETLGFKAFKDFMGEFNEESDRAAVIIGIARLDTVLLQILQKVMVPSTGNDDELLEGDSPLGTFHARIHCAFRLGLIDASVARALHICRRIRNTFAHELAGSSLDAGSHRERIRELILPLKVAINSNSFARGSSIRRFKARRRTSE